MSLAQFFRYSLDDPFPFKDARYPFFLVFNSTEFFEAQEVTQDMGTLPEKAEPFFPWHLGHVRGSTLYIF
jgi:hypothetical protein